ncbi:hypothetical protein JCM19236_3554 [Vibrio sp. JCM 19236]|nr:hypothetical protein JCM19236_3554 [Vibrio sp. JCM 19236]
MKNIKDQSLLSVLCDKRDDAIAVLNPVDDSVLAIYRFVI